MVGRQRAAQFLGEDIGQGTDAGIEDDVADLAHRLLFHVRQFLERHRFAHHQAHDVQALIFREHQNRFGIEGAGEVLAHAAYAQAVVVA